MLPFNFAPSINFKFLLKVRSFGTEGRPVEKEIPPSPEIFNGVLFRTSDIKDLQVSEPPPNRFQDPAIISVFFFFFNLI